MENIQQSDDYKNTDAQKKLIQILSSAFNDYVAKKDSKSLNEWIYDYLKGNLSDASDENVKKIREIININVDLYDRLYDSLKSAIKDGRTKASWFCGEVLSDDMDIIRKAHVLTDINSVLDSSDLLNGSDEINTSNIINSDEKYWNNIKIKELACDVIKKIESSVLGYAVCSEGADSDDMISTISGHADAIMTNKEYKVNGTDLKTVVSCALEVADEKDLLPEKSLKTEEKVLVASISCNVSENIRAVASKEKTPTEALEDIADSGISAVSATVKNTVAETAEKTGMKIGEKVGSLFGPIGFLTGKVVGTYLGRMIGNIAGDKITEAANKISEKAKKFISGTSNIIRNSKIGKVLSKING